MQHLRPLLREQQHIVVGDALAAHRIGADTRVGGKDTVHIGVDDEFIGVKRRGERHGARIRTAAPERCDIALLIKALKARHDRNAPRVQLPPDARGIDHFDLRVAVRAVRFNGHLPRAERNGIHSQRLKRQRAERRAHLLARCKQRIHLASVRRRRQLKRFFEQRIGRISLRRENDDHIVSLGPALSCDMCHAQQALCVAHRAAAEFLHDQAHLHHFQQKNGPAGYLCGSRQSIV